MIIPLTTDAPIYYWPWMTLVLVAANVAVFFATDGGLQDAGWLLQFGNGLHPAEWLTSNFLHFGWLHLIGNMIFLWGFGIVVEGKLGWWRYLLLYLFIGVLGGFLVQLAMLGSDDVASGSGGASLCIYGLLAICIVWAPKNEVDCFVLILYRAMIVEVSLLTFGGWYVALELFAAWWNGFAMSSEMLHLTGAIIGFVAALVMLKWKWVDCENWDLIAVWNGTYGTHSRLGNWHDKITVSELPMATTSDSEKPKKLKKKRAFRPTIYLPRRPRRLTEQAPQPDEKAHLEKTSAGSDTDDSSEVRSLESVPPATRKSLRQIREFLKAGKPQAALVEYQRRLRIIDHWPLDAPDLRALAEGLYRIRAWTEATLLLEEFVERFPGRDDGVTLKLAGVYCEVQKRPRAALRLLESVDQSDLPPEASAIADQIRHRAERLIEDGVLELDGRNW